MFLLLRRRHESCLSHIQRATLRVVGPSCVPPGTTGITLALAQDVATLSLLHVVQVRSGRPSFRVLAVKRFEGAAFVESNLWKDQECES